MATRTKTQSRPVSGNASAADGHRLLEYTTSRGARLSIDRDDTAGVVVIRGVKVLGLESANNRTYTREALRDAAQLYEGKPVNVDHMDGSRRSYRDRIGKLANVTLKDDGLRGDLMVNPKHPLAEQLLWDASHAPENVGLSHDATGRTKSRERDGRVIVEAIVSVRSVDLVAEPATTQGLYEDMAGNGTTRESKMELADLTLDELRSTRPDLVESVVAGTEHEKQNKAMREERDALKGELDGIRRGEAVARELAEAKIAKDRVPKHLLDAMTAADDASRKKLIEELAPLLDRTEEGDRREAARTPESKRRDGAALPERFEDRVAAWR